MEWKTYLKGVPQADNERVVDFSQHLDFGDDVLDGVLLDTRLLVDVLHGEHLLAGFPLDEANLKRFKVWV